jgi:hypothetical protein
LKILKDFDNYKLIILRLSATSFEKGGNFSLFQREYPRNEGEGPWSYLTR